MSNTITIELCAEDRARQDKLIEKLDELITVLESMRASSVPTSHPTEPQETLEEEPKAETLPTEETPQETTQEPESTVPDEVVEPTVTIEQIQQKVVQLAAAGTDKKAKVREIISAYGTKVSDLKDKPEKWDEVWQKLTALEA